VNRIMKPARPPEAATYRSDPSLPGIELLQAHYTAHQFAPHSHEAFAVGVVLSGALSFRYRSPSEVVPTGHIMIIHPGEVHTGRCVGGRGCAYCMLYATPKTVRSVFPERKGATVDFPFFPNQTIDDPCLAERMVQLHSLLESPGASLLEKESGLISVLARLVGRHARPRPPETPRRTDKAFTRTALEFIEDRYSENISLRDLAERTPISPFHLLREFKKQYGLAPHAYLSQLRIRKAKQLLKGRAPLADIALQIGFCDQAQFTRRFKQIVGTTPGRYRRQQ
jgi:AraC-like DNA-binding protein